MNEPTVNTNQDRQTDAWEKWDWLWNIAFYGSILGSVILMLLGRNITVPLWQPLLLTAVLLVWHWGGLRLISRDSPSPEDRPVLRFVIIIGDILLWFALVSISPAYYLVLFGLFGQVFRHLTIGYAVPSVVILTGAIIVEQVNDSDGSFNPTNPTVWPFLLMGLAGILLGFWVKAIIDQSMRRRQLIEELEEAQAELAAAERREGVLEERQRLAREIHDTLAQGFTSIVMNLEAADQALPDDLARVQKYMDQARSTARDSLDQARRVVQDLRPDLLDQYSLPDALERMAVRWQGETDMPLTTSMTGDPMPLHPNIEVTLLRAAQEALNNVNKHAQATDVQLTLSYMGDVVMLDVQDNGVGLAGAEPSRFAGGYGLQAMRERVAQCGGIVTLESDPGEGTTVTVTIPLAGQSLAIIGDED